MFRFFCYDSAGYSGLGNAPVYSLDYLERLVNFITQLYGDNFYWLQTYRLIRIILRGNGRFHSRRKYNSAKRIEEKLGYSKV